MVPQQRGADQNRRAQPLRSQGMRNHRRLLVLTGLILLLVARGGGGNGG